MISPRFHQISQPTSPSCSRRFASDQLIDDRRLILFEVQLMAIIDLGYYYLNFLLKLDPLSLKLWND